MTLMTASPSRNCALEGLRGLALVCVLCAHAGLPVFGGSLIMFVLSGFLITMSLLKEHDRTGRIDSRVFYGRRASRLLPALIIMLIALNLLVLWLRPDMSAQLRSDSLAALAFVANWTQVIWEHGSLLMHLWSLSVQEQVYLVWPVLMCAVMRGPWGVRVAVCLGVAVGVCSLRIALVLSGAPLTTVYFMTLTRVDGVFLGSALAFGLPRLRALSQPLVRVLSSACVLILGICLTLYPLHSPLTYLISMPTISICTAVLIAVCVLSPMSIAPRALSWRVLVHLGTISYGVYLWHYPVVVVLSGHTAYAGVIGVMSGLILGEVSYRWIERPLMTARTWTENRAALRITRARETG